MKNDFNYLSMEKFLEKCSWSLDLLCYGDEDGHLSIPNSKNIQHLQPFRAGQFWNPILVNYPDNLPNRIFCRLELLSSLEGILDQLDIDQYILYAGHTDVAIDDSFIPFLENPRLIKMFGLCNQIEHPKLGYVPLGPRLQDSYGLRAMDKMIISTEPKTSPYYVRFSLETNIEHRTQCLQYLKKPLSPPVATYEEYLLNIKKSYFMPVPRGNNSKLLSGLTVGTDHHQLWECFYMRTIPIVLESLTSKHYQQFFPFVTLKDWSEFDPDMLTPELYNELWAKYPNIENDLKFDYFFENYCL